MSLEKRVNELMDRAIEASVPMLEATTAQRDPNALLSPKDMFLITSGQIAGIKRAIRLLAREIDQMRDI